jgi:hypothetical protein
MQSYLPACKIVSTHGVRGEMKALPLCDGAEFLAKFKRLYAAADGTGECRVLGVRTQGNVILLRLADVTDMDAARAQVGRTYYFAKADARLPKGRYFIDDLLGCEVRDAGTGAVYGILTTPPPRTSTPSPMLQARSTCCPPCQSLSRPSTSTPARSWSPPSTACSTMLSTVTRSKACVSIL